MPARWEGSFAACSNDMSSTGRERIDEWKLAVVNHVHPVALVAFWFLASFQKRPERTSLRLFRDLGEVLFEVTTPDRFESSHWQSLGTVPLTMKTALS